MHNRFKIFISIVVVAMFLGTGLASYGETANTSASSNAAEALSPAFGEVVNTWSLSGRTCAPSSASSGSTVALKIDVTSFSESSCAGPTVMYFVVNNKKIHSTDVDGTGVYTYNWSPAYANTTVSFHAEYLSGSEFMEEPSMHYAERRPMVFFRNSYSTFGNSDIYIKWLQDCHRYMGYEGNNKIYLSSTPLSSYLEYGNSPLSPVCSTYSGSGIAKNSVDIGESSFYESSNGVDLNIYLNLTDVGAGNQYFSDNAVYGPAKLQFNIATSSPYASPTMVNGKYAGYNITGMDGKQLTEANDLADLIADGISLVPVPYLDYAITSAEAAGTVYSLIQCVNSPSSSSDVQSDYCIIGGNSQHNVYAAGDCAEIRVSCSDLSNSFTTTVDYSTYYLCGTVQSQKASTTETINAVTASAIYGCVEYPATGNIDKVNNRHVYIKDTETGESYRVPIVNGHYLFYAEPGTDYSISIYKHSLDKFNPLTTLDGSELKDGSSYRYVIYSDDL